MICLLFNRCVIWYLYYGHAYYVHQNIMVQKLLQIFVLAIGTYHLSCQLMQLSSGIQSGTHHFHQRFAAEEELA